MKYIQEPFHVKDVELKETLSRYGLDGIVKTALIRFRMHLIRKRGCDCWI